MAWRSGSQMHDDLVRSLGSGPWPDPDDLANRIYAAVDDRVQASFLHVDPTPQGIRVRAWTSTSTTPVEVPMHDTDSARAFARRIVPFIVEHEAAAERAMRGVPGRS